MYWKQWLQTLLSLVILFGILELLLPSGDLAKFARFVIGLALMLAVLQPIILIINQDAPVLSLNWLNPLAEPELEIIGDRVRLAAAAPFLDNGGELLGQTEQALLQLTGVKEVKVSRLAGGQAGALVQVKVDPFEASTNHLVEQTVSSLLNLPVKAIQIRPLVNEGGDLWVNYGAD